MIASAAEYEYVVGADVDEAHPHGDLDRIQIDGEVMPKRTGDTGKTDADGNAIPRTKILRGEDVAFLMEAALQRKYGNWWTERVTWYWLGDSMKRTVTDTNTNVFTRTFTRKVSAAQLARLRNDFDDACDWAVLSPPNEVKTSDWNMGFADVYFPNGFSGLSDSLRPYKNYPLPAFGSGIGSYEPVTAYFLSLQMMPCALLDGNYMSLHEPNHKNDFGFVIEGDDVFSGNGGVYEPTSFAVYSSRKKQDDGDGGHDEKAGTAYAYPKPDFEMLRVKAPHVAALTVILRLDIRLRVDRESDVTRSLWLPVAAEKDGDWFVLTAGGCGFASKEGFADILDKAGVGVPVAPSIFVGSLSSYANAVVADIAATIFGTWDDHTKVE